ncbi:MAG TPA: cytochrome-c oxidase [Bacteroidales bacterium]|jgi:cytochrome c oxidase subunit 4|nr:cytochrome-c oxidase [Bacteroidales bacterium]
MDNHENHIVPLKTYLLILGALLVFTFLSIAITLIDLGPLAVAGALLFAMLKTTLIVFYFMHLKFENKMYAIFGGVVLLTFIVVIILTFSDYMFQ